MRKAGDFTIDRLAAQAPEAVQAARAAVLKLPTVKGTFGMVQRRDKLPVLAALNEALAAKGIEAVTYSMFNGWAKAVRRNRPN